MVRSCRPARGGERHAGEDGNGQGAGGSPQPAGGHDRRAARQAGAGDQGGRAAGDATATSRDESPPRADSEPTTWPRGNGHATRTANRGRRRHRRRQPGSDVREHRETARSGRPRRPPTRPRSGRRSRPGRRHRHRRPRSPRARRRSRRRRGRHRPPAAIRRRRGRTDGRTASRRPRGPPPTATDRIPFRGVRTDHRRASAPQRQPRHPLHGHGRGGRDRAGELRRRLVAASNEKITLLPFVAFAVCRVLSGRLARIRRLNSTVDDDRRRSSSTAPSTWASRPTPTAA